MQTAYTDAAGRSHPNYFNLGAGNIGGRTLRPGLYKWTSSVNIPTGAVTLGTTSHFEGTILSKTGIKLRTGASINGRLLAQTAVTLQKSTVKRPL